MTTLLHLNIVSLDVPLPADYGGAIDIFYKLKALHAQEVIIYLHCFRSDRQEQAELLTYCKEVHYYERKTGPISNLSFFPYITYSRRSRKLVDRLRSNDYPILLEGLHSAYALFARELRGRKFLLRSHNIEHDYYRYLAARERNLLKKLYYYKESFLLKRILSKLPANLLIGAISTADVGALRSKFKNTFWLPPFHSANEVVGKIGSGRYALYHGNLSVSENAEVAGRLITAFAGKQVHLIVAGKGIPESLQRQVGASSNIELIANPTTEKMDELIRNAHVILLPTYQPTGIKLKLIESLYRGRFCIANAAMVAGTHLEELVVLTEDDFYGATQKLMNILFTQDHIATRDEVLGDQYDNEKNAQLLIKGANVEW